MILTAIWLVPVLGAILIEFAPRRLARMAGLVVATAVLALTLVLAVGFMPARAGFQFSEQLPWVPQYSIFYHLGVDGISLWLLVLNALLTPIALLAAGGKIKRPRGFTVLLLLQEGAMAGLFMATDLVLFYVFWEAMLIPAYLLLWLWGEGERPGRAALKFVLYTLAGSLLMLVGVIVEYLLAGGGSHTFELGQLAAQPPEPATQFGLFGLFALAFAIKLPLLPFHGWLPEAYASAPAAFLVTFAGVMSKTGAYAMLRVLLPLFPHPQLWWNWNDVLPVLAVLGVVWGALMALTQSDTKLVVAYSSVSHMGFIVLGIFSFTHQGQQGAVLQMVNHGLIIPALFLLVTWTADRCGTRKLWDVYGLAPRIPILAGVFLVVTLAALGLPGLNSFVGEFMILLGAWQFSPGLAVAACIGLVLAPLYLLRLFQGLMYARLGESPAHSPDWARGLPRLPDLAPGELVLMSPLLGLMLLLGLYPALLIGAIP